MLLDRLQYECGKDRERDREGERKEWQRQSRMGRTTLQVDEIISCLQLAQLSHSVDIMSL